MNLILVTNDDGIESPGLRTVVEAVLPLGDVVVVAPSRQQTSAGRSFTGSKSEYLKELDYSACGKPVKAYHCDCSPARAILHAFDVLFNERKPALVVSGINYGENLGTNVTISGTVGATIEAAAHGVCGLAVSLQTKMEEHFKYPELDWDAARHFTREIATLMLENDFPADVDVLNLNIPASATTQTAYRWTKLSRHGYFSNIVPDPKISSRIGDAKCCYGFDESRLEPDSDILAFSRGFVTVSPISMDMTSRVSLDSLPACCPAASRFPA
jgi:5'-nucleotidase